MRNAFCQEMVTLYKKDPFVFLTGDLGFMALEPLQTAMGNTFINAGVAEQNMIGVAAGIARSGHQVWAYSIAPFIYARPLEQIRNDICLHKLPVRLVGNGGGYGYGVMGATHHAIEDYGILTGLQGMKAYVPAFKDDIAPMVARMQQYPSPAYFRLGRCEKPEGTTLPPYAPWRQLLAGKKGIAIVIGPLVGPIWATLGKLPEKLRPSLWVVSELPFTWRDVPHKLAVQMQKQPIAVVEEHVRQGGAGQMLAAMLLEHKIMPEHFAILCAQGYPSGKYGSQAFCRQESGLTAEHILTALAGKK